MTERRLTNKQRVFIEEYLVCWNAAEAARRAGYSENTAAETGYENLTKPHIADAIKKRIAERAMSADEVLLRLGQQARAEQSRFWKIVNGRPVLDFQALADAGLMHLVREVQIDSDTGEASPKFYDAQKALQLLGTHHKLFAERAEVSGPGGAPLAVQFVPYASDDSDGSDDSDDTDHS